jgi:formylglycine-generating enzyme required for sulfatase activity/uncharacterized caspase-like protein
MSRLQRAFAMAVAGTLLAISQASAQKRVALVIGNSGYQHTSQLENPKNDATDMVAALKKVGFQVVEGFDLDKTVFERKVRDFSVALRGAEVGVFFYAGHGLQVAGANYLVPIDAKAETADALDWEMVRLDLVHRTMERATTTNIIFLDACRNNPLARNLARAMGTRSAEIGRGLAPVESGVGTLISFSTQPGNVALDGTGRNSPFAGALVKRIPTFGEDLSALLIDVRNDVRKATQNAQIPWEHSALTGRFYFNQPKVVASSPAGPSRLSEAAEAWNAAERTTSITALEAFITRFKDTFYADLARARIEELKKQQLAAASTPSLSKSPPDEPSRPAAVVLPAPCHGIETLVASEKRCLKPKEGFRDCPGCPEMVVIPAGEFVMGSNVGYSGSNDTPSHNVSITRPFAAGKFEVTFAEWDACVSAGGCAHKPSDWGWGRENKPVIDVSWEDITREFLPWLSRKTSRPYRLLTEAEWEYAARGVTTASAFVTKYYWGDDIGKNLANCDGCGSQWDKKGTAPVGSFTPNVFGLHDTHGNVEEWVEDCWHENYKGAPADGSGWTGDCLPISARMVRGGAWNSIPISLNTVRRERYAPSLRRNKLGFRIARTL